AAGWQDVTQHEHRFDADQDRESGLEPFARAGGQLVLEWREGRVEEVRASRAAERVSGAIGILEPAQEGVAQKESELGLVVADEVVEGVLDQGGAILWLLGGVVGKQ